MFWIIGVLIALVGITAGYFLSASVVVVLTIIGIFAVVWATGINDHTGNETSIISGSLLIVILLFIVPMAITALVVRFIDISINWHLLR